MDIFKPRKLISKIMLLFVTPACLASTGIEPPKIGNFALPYSQQPGPLIGFGENILDRNDWQLFIYADNYAGVNRHGIDLTPSVLYGITDNLSMLISVPYAANYQQASFKSSGFEDANVQVEYAFYNTSSAVYTNQATVLVSASTPTGSGLKKPPTGFGAPTVFFGITFNRTYVEWFVFGAPGILLTTAKNGTKLGNNYLYQFGFGKNITNINGWIFAWMIEIDGTYNQRNRVNGIIDVNSGGNTVYVTPSIWASNRHFVFQFGAGAPVTQHLLGNQTQETYLLALNLAWKI